jgi:hypothetical protein
MAVRRRRFLDRKRPNADIKEGHISAAPCHMANISYRVGNRKLEFDISKEAFVNDQEVDHYLKWPYRAPWDGVMG